MKVILALICFVFTNLAQAKFTPFAEIKDVLVQDGNRVILAELDDKEQLIHVGSKLEIFRSGKRLSPSLASKQIKTGEAVVIHSDQNIFLARISSEKTAESNYFFPNFAGVMIGDKISMRTLDIQASLQIAENLSFTYSQLFIDPNASPSNFQLSSRGKEYLAQAADSLGRLKVAMLIIEAHTDATGASSANQIESYQRALTVRQYLSDTFNFDRSRLLPIGMGETEALQDNFLTESKANERKIVFRVKSQMIAETN